MVEFAVPLIELVKLPSSMIHNSTSGFGEPGVGYLTDLEGGKEPLLGVNRGLELGPSCPGCVLNQGNSRAVTLVSLNEAKRRCVPSELGQAASGRGNTSS